MEQKNRYLIIIFLVILLMNFVTGFIEKGMAFDWFFMTHEGSFLISLIIVAPMNFVAFY